MPDWIHRINTRRIAALIMMTAMVVVAGMIVLMLAGQSERAVLDEVSEARRALDLVNDARAYPNAEIPETGFADAFTYARAHLQKRSHTDRTWRAIGPKNIGGRTLALAFNPQNANTLYAGSASGGLWRSHSAGVGVEAWTYVPTGFPVLGVAAIAIAPDDSSTIYIGTGEVYGSPETFPGVGIRTTRGSYGIGILKTTDGGATWTKSLDWTLDQRRGVQKIRINPQRPATVWAATSVGVYRSYDAGTTWARVHPIVMATDIKINPVDTSVVFVAHGGMGSPGHGIYRTTDAGTNWQKMNLGPDGPDTFFGKAVLAMAPADPDMVWAGIGNSDGLSTEPLTWLVKTTNGGASWSVVSTEDYSIIQGWYAHTLAVHPTNPDSVWTAGMRFSPWLSTQGGTALRQADEIGLVAPATGLEGDVYPHLHLWADYHDIVFHPEDPTIIYFANDGGVFRTTDAGQTMENCNGGYQVTQFYNGFANAVNDSIFAVGGMQDNNSALYEGSPFWKRVGGGDGGWTAILGNTLYLSAQRLTLFTQPQRGDAGFINITPPNRVGPSFIAPFVLSPANPRVIYAGSQLIHRSVNSGANWLDMNDGEPLDGGNPILSLAASHQEFGVVYAATAPLTSRARVFRTTDGGFRWADITGPLPDRFPTDLAVDPSNDLAVYATFGGFGSGHVFKSLDGGETWADISAALPDVPTWAVTVDPRFSDHLYVGNDLGVFQSIDGGLNWTQLEAGLPDAVIAFDLAVSPVNRKLRVATHGNGVYERGLEDRATPTETAPEGFTLTLEPTYPNPFRTQTIITYRLAAPAPVHLAVYDVTGRLVATLVEGRRSAGQHQMTFDGSDLASGTYLLRLDASGARRTRTMTVVK